MSETVAPAQNSAVLKPPSYSGLVLAVFVAFIYSISSTAAYAVLNYPETLAGEKRMRLGLVLSFSIIFAIAYFNRIAKGVAKCDPAACAKARRALENLHLWFLRAFGAAWLFVILVEFFTAKHYTPSHFTSGVLLPVTWGIAMAAASAFLVMDKTAYSKTTVALLPRLYTAQELLERRRMPYIPISAKLYLLLGVLGGTMVTITALMLCCLQSSDSLDTHYITLSLALLIGASVTALSSVEWVAGAIKTPLEGLIAKMDRLAQGDFNVKTHIFFNDEVSRLKAAFNTLSDQLREREQLRETFGKYVSIEVARRLMESGALDLGGEEMEATVLFCDIRNFTPLSEKLPPKELVDFLNSYFSYIAPCVMHHGGVINKFMGDAILAIYTPALGSAEGHVNAALESALEMRAALEEYNKSGKSPVRVSFGIGIHTGRMVAGNVGLENRLEYTVIGDTVNLASRLDSKNKELGTDILISNAVYNAVREHFSGRAVFNKIPNMQIKGKSQVLDLYTVNEP